MGDLVAELRKKIAAVIFEHGNSVSDNEENIISEENKSLFSSCQRWHENAHMTTDDWIYNFDQIREKLNIDGSGLVNPPKEIMNMLAKKFKEDSCPQSMFGINDIFSPQFQFHIKGVFEDMVGDRDGDDEFGLDHIFQGWKPDDVTFCSKTFMPVAIFYSYKHRHTYASDQEIFTECFSVGAGSRRDDLIPEVNAFCQRCSADQMENKNKQIFLLQFKNDFNLPEYREDSIKGRAVRDISEADSSESIDGEQVRVKKVFNPMLSESSESDHQEMFSKKAVFNPLLSESSDGDSSEGDSPENDSPEDILKKALSEQELKPYKCLICPKCFRKEKFVKMHLSIFHQRKRMIVVPEFVKEPIEMMTSFSVENQLNTNSTEKESHSNEGEKRANMCKKKKFEGILRVQPKRGKVLKSDKKTVKKALLFDE